MSSYSGMRNISSRIKYAHFELFAQNNITLLKKPKHVLIYVLECV